MTCTWLRPRSSRWTQLSHLPLPVPALALSPLQGDLGLWFCTCRSIHPVTTGTWPATHVLPVLRMRTTLPSMKICLATTLRIRVIVLELIFGRYHGTIMAVTLETNCGSNLKVCHFLSSFLFDKHNKGILLFFVRCISAHRYGQGVSSKKGLLFFLLPKVNGMFPNNWYWETTYKGVISARKRLHRHNNRDHSNSPAMRV